MIAPGPKGLKYQGRYYEHQLIPSQSSSRYACIDSVPNNKSSRTCIELINSVANVTLGQEVEGGGG